MQPQLVHIQLEVGERVRKHGLDSQTGGGLAVALLVTGVVIGPLGTFLSLSW